MRKFAYLKDRGWVKSVVKDAFGPSFWGFLFFAIATGIICYWILGEEVLRSALEKDVSLFLDLLPRVLVAISVAALLWVLLPRDKISKLIGKSTGIKGLIVATLAGTITPGGPSSAYALLAVLAASGAERGALVAYITAWATLGLQRVLVWDVPFMGAEFALVRFAICLPLPIVAGLIARKVPFELIFKNEENDVSPAVSSAVPNRKRKK